MDQVTHLVPCVASAGLLIRTGATRNLVHPFPDRLTLGPCAQAPEVHRALRETWNEGLPFAPFGLEELGHAAAEDGPVVLWGSRGFSDVVWIAWALDGIGRLG